MIDWLSWERSREKNDENGCVCVWEREREGKSDVQCNEDVVKFRVSDYFDAISNTQ